MDIHSCLMGCVLQKEWSVHIMQMSMGQSGCNRINLSLDKQHASCDISMETPAELKNAMMSTLALVTTVRFPSLLTHALLYIFALKSSSTNDCRGCSRAFTYNGLW